VPKECGRYGPYYYIQVNSILKTGSITSADKTGMYVVATFVVSVVILAVISLVITGLDVAALG
jgi:hypothetical protein